MGHGDLGDLQKDIIVIAPIAAVVVVVLVIVILVAVVLVLVIVDIFPVINIIGNIYSWPVSKEAG